MTQESRAVSTGASKTTLQRQELGCPGEAVDSRDEKTKHEVPEGPWGSGVEKDCWVSKSRNELSEGKAMRI